MKGRNAQKKKLYCQQNIYYEEERSKEKKFSYLIIFREIFFYLT